MPNSESRQIYWRTKSKSGLDVCTVTQQSDGSYNLTPSYNQQTKGAKRANYKSKVEALAELRKYGEIEQIDVVRRVREDFKLKPRSRTRSRY